MSEAPGPIAWQLVTDGAASYPREVIFAHVQAEELQAAGIGEEVVTPYNSLLIRAPGGLVLVDAGMGHAAAQVGAPAGRLLSNLDAQGVRPHDIGDVVITHAHADHVGGLTLNGDLAFPAARHHLQRSEWAFWMQGDPRPRLFAPLADLLAETATSTLSRLADADVLVLHDDETELTPGVRLLPAPGHTPGHIAVELDNGGDALLYLTDAVLHELQFQRTHLTAAVDVDPPMCIATRRALLQRAADSHTTVAGFHLPRVGRVVAAGAGYRFEPDPRDQETS
jgi:glyoxylase-like metal-dependent hydrolase (beta-lactamase superfamily II)